jgi:hypothetical protein
VNRSEDSHSLQVYVPGATKIVRLLESQEPVARIRHGRVRLRDLKGLGGSLSGQDPEGQYDFDTRCWDTGPVRSFVPPILGQPAQLAFCRDIDPRDPGRKIILWLRETSRRTKHHTVSILPTSRKRAWRFDVPISEAPLAVATTFKGLRIGAWWDLDRIEEFFSQCGEPRTSDFALLRWFRVPILDETRLIRTRECCIRSPVKFLSAWRGGAVLPADLTFRSDEDTTLVPRKLLWAQRFDIPSWAECLDSVSRCANADTPETCVKRFGTFLHLSLGLLTQLLLKCRRQCPERCGTIRGLFLQEQLGLAPDASETLRWRRLRECKERSSSVAGANPDDADTAFSTWIAGARLDPASQFVSTLQALGQTLQGRKYLACMLVRQVLAER